MTSPGLVIEVKTEHVVSSRKAHVTSGTICRLFSDVSSEHIGFVINDVDVAAVGRRMPRILEICK